MRRNLLIALAAVLILAAFAWGQGGDPRPNFQGLPVWLIDTSNNFVKVGDLTNHALRVNVVAGAGSGGTASNFAAAFPSSGTAVGFKDTAGLMASGSIDNLGNLLVGVTNTTGVTVAPGDAVNNAVRVNIVAGAGAGGTSSNFAAAFPSAGTAAGFRDGASRMASATVDNAGNLFVIASQSASAWTVTATGTISAHQADAWTVTANQGTTPWQTNVQQWLGSTAPTVGQKTMANSVPVVLSSDQSTLPVQADTSAATGTIAPSRVEMIGGTGQSANPSRIIACDNYASITLANNTTTLLVTGSTAQLVYICSINLVVSSATAVNFVEGVGTFCNTNVQGIFGGTATASGWNFASNGGLTQGTGVGMIGKTKNTGNNVCLQNSTAATIAGGITWTKF